MDSLPHSGLPVFYDPARRRWRRFRRTVQIGAALLTIILAAMLAGVQIDPPLPQLSLAPLDRLLGPALPPSSTPIASFEVLPRGLIPTSSCTSLPSRTPNISVVEAERALTRLQETATFPREATPPFDEHMAKSTPPVPSAVPGTSTILLDPTAPPASTGAPTARIPTVPPPAPTTIPPAPTSVPTALYTAVAPSARTAPGHSRTPEPHQTEPPGLVQ